MRWMETKSIWTRPPAGSCNFASFCLGSSSLFCTSAVFLSCGLGLCLYRASGGCIWFARAVNVAKLWRLNKYFSDLHRKRLLFINRRIFHFLSIFNWSRYLIFFTFWIIVIRYFWFRSISRVVPSDLSAKSLPISPVFKLMRPCAFLTNGLSSKIPLALTSRENSTGVSSFWIFLPPWSSLCAQSYWDCPVWR